MKLEKLADISERVSATSSKKEKVSLIAGLLKQAKDKEISLAAHYLSGQLPQGRLEDAPGGYTGSLLISPLPDPHGSGCFFPRHRY